MPCKCKHHPATRCHDTEKGKDQADEGKPGPVNQLSKYQRIGSLH